MNAQRQTREPYRLIPRRAEVELLLEAITEMVGYDLSFAVFLKVQADRYQAMRDEEEWERNEARAR